MNLTLRSTHYEGTPHRTWEDVHTSPDAWSFVIPSGSPVHEADGRVWSSDYPVVAWFWPDAYYQVFLLLKRTGAEYYCNIITPPVYDASQHTVVFCDLDLDVRLGPNGLKVVDEDEFAARKRRYPRSVVTAALAARDQLMNLGAARRGPFSAVAAARWRTVLETATRG